MTKLNLARRTLSREYRHQNATAAMCGLKGAGPKKTPARLDYAAINARALASLPALVARWLPGGRREGREYVVRNPTRNDRNAGSFKVNLATGRWADFATGHKGGDPVSLAAYLAGIGQAAAARQLAQMLDVGIAG